MPLGDDAATLFVTEVKKIVPKSTVIPVWTTECEQHDGAEDGLCAGVGCYDGICWKAYCRQLAPLESVSPLIGVLAPYKAFRRDLPIYGKEAAWVKHVVQTFVDMPEKHGRKPIVSSRLVVVLQGWDVTAAELAAQATMAREAGVQGYIVSFSELDQSWRPQIEAWR